jgi:DNA topoisomerase-1
MRTDSDKYAGVFLEQLDTFVMAEYRSKEYLGDLNNLENKDASNPHEAIRVCGLQMRDIPDGADSKEAILYKLIWRNTVESCMSSAKYNSVLAKITAPNIKEKSAYFTRVLELPTFLGWKVVSSGNSGKEDPVVAEYLYLKIQETVAKNPVPFQRIDSTVVVRNKHSHYTEASLIKKLEDLGIGRPSTFATLVETIQDRGYVKCQDLKGDIRKCIEFSLKSPNAMAKVESEKTFGNEKNKLVIQPVGILCIEYLVKVFDKLFCYDYTKSMESVLDEIAHNKGDANWYDICKSCYTDIKTLSKTVENLGKQTFRIDESNDLVFQEFGPCIRSLESDGKAIYKPVKNGDKIDLEKATAGKYSLSDLLAIPNENLGSYQDKPVLLKIGKYGPYVEWFGKKVSIKDIGIMVDKIRLEDAIKVLEPAPKSENKESKSILRVINLDISIRQGKFGPYIYYKTKKMKNPDFFNIKKFPCNYEDCDPGLVIEWVKHQIEKKQ